MDEPYYEAPDSNLYAIPAAGGEIETVIDIPGSVTEAALAPDGSRWAFDGELNPAQVQSHTRGDVFVYAAGRRRP